jgi:TolB-like protein
MSSIIEGYNYDIFISYRQKDNKHDGWVTEFVHNLKGELESTFKEDVNVYYDINPHDGLLETHDVDASLKEKLKCLIFIPIISRTYCDPKSFAWEHEFKAFVDLASHDQFGLKVKLLGGNVASRVLPVQIHDLDADDRMLVETELGGYIRGIEFIYKEPGVNKPLTPRDDDKKNLNSTKYEIQVNKAANSIKEIIAGLKNPSGEPKLSSQKKSDEKPSKRKTQTKKIITGSLLLLLLVVAGYFVIPKLIKPKEQSEKSVAVLPFLNYSEDPKEYMSDGLTDEIINNLYKIKSFDKVVSIGTSMTYKGTLKTIPQIANELNVNYILEGSYKKIGDNVRINAQLVDPKKDKYLWQHEYDQSFSQIIEIQADIALQIADQIKAYLTSSERKKIQKNATVNPEAYNLYMQGRYLWNQRTKDELVKSIDFFEKSAAADPDYALAFAGLADAYNTLVFWDWLPGEEGILKAKKYALKAIEIDPDLAEAHAVVGDILLWSDWKWDEAGKELKLATELNPNCAVAHQYYSEYLDIVRDFKAAREEINIALKLDPVSSAIQGTSALYYYNEGKFSESVDASLKLIEINPDFSKNYFVCMFSYLEQGEDRKAFEIFRQLISRDKNTEKYADELNETFSKFGINGIFNWIIRAELIKPSPSSFSLAWAYANLGNKDETLKWLEKAYMERSPGLSRINSFYVFNKIRSEPGFLSILEKMGLSKFNHGN